MFGSGLIYFASEDPAAMTDCGLIEPAQNPG